MLTQVSIDGENSITLPIAGVLSKDSLLLRKITGLSPPDLTLFIGDYSRDGGTYQGRRVGNRNVVMTIDLNPNPALGETISGWRNILHKAFVDPEVDADFVAVYLYDDDGSIRYFLGYTESFESEVFDVDTSILVSMICPDPYLRDSEATVLSSSPGWITVPFTYQGTADTGFEAEVHVSAPTSTLTLSNNGKVMVLTTLLSTTDVVYFNTVRGSRKIWKASATDVASVWAANPGLPINDIWQILYDDGDVTSLLATFTGTWIDLHAQDNSLMVYGSLTTDLIAGIQNVTYRAAYWGI